MFKAERIQSSVKILYKLSLLNCFQFVKMEDSVDKLNLKAINGRKILGGWGFRPLQSSKSREESKWAIKLVNAPKK